MERWARRLPWIDRASALTAGALVLIFRDWLVDLDGLSVELLTFVGLVNLAYSVPGLTLGALRHRPAWLLRGLIAANLVWVVACVAMASIVATTAHAFGLAHLLGEGLFVAALALLEARYAKVILTA